MSLDTRILNLTRNTRLKPHQAESRIAANVSEWVEYGISIRDLNLAEIMAHRAEQSRREVSESNPLHKRGEIPGVIFLWPDSLTWKRDHEAAQRQIVREAYEAQQ